MKNDHIYRSKSKNGRTPEDISEEIDLYSISSQIYFPCKFNSFFLQVFINFFVPHHLQQLQSSIVISMR